MLAPSEHLAIEPCRLCRTSQVPLCALLEAREEQVHALGGVGMVRSEEGCADFEVRLVEAEALGEDLAVAGLRGSGVWVERCNCVRELAAL